MDARLLDPVGLAVDIKGIDVQKILGGLRPGEDLDVSVDSVRVYDLSGFNQFQHNVLRFLSE